MRRPNYYMISRFSLFVLYQLNFVVNCFCGDEFNPNSLYSSHVPLDAENFPKKKTVTF
jgi:hypothetical protein